MANTPMLKSNLPGFFDNLTINQSGKIPYSSNFASGKIPYSSNFASGKIPYTPKPKPNPPAEPGKKTVITSDDLLAQHAYRWNYDPILNKPSNDPTKRTQFTRADFTISEIDYNSFLERKNHFQKHREYYENRSDQEQYRYHNPIEPFSWKQQ
jgi:hypothetical protein